MSKELTIQGIHIQTLYSEYINKKFLVNRKYQRKLAWTIEEKRNFIDTILNGLPVPLFLIAEVKYEGQNKLEIIDGMQRLDAIFSFIQQKYRIKDGYFDLSVMVDSFNLMNKGELKQEKPVISSEESKVIANYLLPVSKSLLLNKDEIEETFRRINSNGKHLSSQELRQAGAIGLFPEIVRRLSAGIRGDASSDNLVLNDMSKISLGNKRLEYYGIDINEIFWVKNIIISYDNIRESKDEELVGHIISNMILERKHNYAASSLDAFYGFSANPLAPSPIEKTEIENAIDRIGVDILQRQFNAVFSVIDDLFTKNKVIFRDFIYSNQKTFDNYRAFQAVFMAFFDLIVKGNKKVGDEKKLLESLHFIGDRLLQKEVIDKLYDCEVLDKTADAIRGTIEKAFIEREISDPAYDDWTSEFSKILMQSMTEQDQYDFKIGLFDVKTGLYNKNLVLKIAKTLTAINNNGQNKVGYVIIGVADNESSAKTYETEYRIDSVKMHDFFITGIENEAIKYCGSVDRYYHKIIETIKDAPIEPKVYLSELLTNVKSRRYYGKEVIVFKTNFNEPVWYDGNLYERYGSDNNIVLKENHGNIYKRFFGK